ncbi:MAG TPA: hypothetical protein VMG34_04520 [Bacteroidota bacterium]|nr:hypothetical protein [Bacteroidota bacterium]
MKTTSFLALFIFFSAFLQAQGTGTKLSLGLAVDTTDADIASVVRLWGDYLASNPDSSTGDPFWLTAEKERYPKHDFLNTVYFSPSLYYFLRYNKPTVMSVFKADSGYIIRTLLASVMDSGYARPFCITRVMAKKEKGEWRLCNVLPYSTRSWHREIVGKITFVFPPDHAFNRPLAERMNAFVDSLALRWHVRPFPIEFYLADDLSDIMTMRGFDFYVGESYNRGTGGLADVANHIVFGAGQDEWYPHEFVHLIVKPLFPNAHYYFHEGYAALVGGSRGHDIMWHMKRIKKYLDDHPELDLNDVLNFGHFDAETDPKYVFGGLICRLALEKGGETSLRALFSFGGDDKDFYAAVEAVLGVKQENLNAYLRRELAAAVIER